MPPAKIPILFAAPTNGLPLPSPAQNFSFMSIVRTRFAPSPTGGLHLGGVRTALFSYLYARHHGGQFVLRIEDTDQSRFVEGAESYIGDCLDWCGLTPDESPAKGGPYGPYRQSERKEIYRQYAEQLLASGHAYYAFDTPEELESRRQAVREANPHATFQVDATTRGSLRNSLTLSPTETRRLLNEGMPHVVRILMPENEIIHFHDMIRGDIENQSNLVDDKVLLKADGMPTYHLAVVVDDYLMKITHAFRGEEWLPSAPVHVKLWEYLGWRDVMPQWAHLPLILKPDGHGKLSKRDGDRLGFPVFAMNWTDPRSGERTTGFREMGFLPEAFVNMLALLGWHGGGEQELFSLQDLCTIFSIERVHKGGAKFDFEKAKWFNHEWIKHTDVSLLRDGVCDVLKQSGIPAEPNLHLQDLIALVKDRCTLLGDFVPNLSYFYRPPESLAELEGVRAKWDAAKTTFLTAWMQGFDQTTFTTARLEAGFKEQCALHGIKPGEVQLPFRLMLVGGKFGPNVFAIAEKLGPLETADRIRKGLSILA